jgi:hypothetical protein
MSRASRYWYEDCTELSSVFVSAQVRQIRIGYSRRGKAAILAARGWLAQCLTPGHIGASTSLSLAATTRLA